MNEPIRVIAFADARVLRQISESLASFGFDLKLVKERDAFTRAIQTNVYQLFILDADQLGESNVALGEVQNAMEASSSMVLISSDETEGQGNGQISEFIKKPVQTKALAAAVKIALHGRHGYEKSTPRSLGRKNGSLCFDDRAVQSQVNLLIVENDPGLREFILERIQEESGFRETVKSELAASYDDVEMLTKRGFTPDLVILDFHLQGSESGLDVAKLLVKRTPKPHILVVTQFWEEKVEGKDLNDAFAEVDPGIKFLEKSENDDDEGDFFKTWENVREILDGKLQIILSCRQSASAKKIGDFVFLSGSMANCIHQALRYAKSDISVLIRGETGTGKELFAKFIHEQSQRGGCTFIPINSRNITETLLDAELYGRAKGAGAQSYKDVKGFVEAADGGTLFFDEIGFMTLPMQEKLLRFLEDRTYYRVGDPEKQPKKSDLRLLAATDQDLEELVRMGAFREQLYFRWAVTINIPPLRERKEDIIPLAKHFVEKFAKEEWGDQCGVKHYLNNSAKKRLEKHCWPGNVRELRDVIRVALLKAGVKRPQISSTDIIFAEGSLKLPKNAMRPIPQDTSDVSGNKSEPRPLASGEQNGPNASTLVNDLFDYLKSAYEEHKKNGSWGILCRLSPDSAAMRHELFEQQYQDLSASKRKLPKCKESAQIRNGISVTFSVLEYAPSTSHFTPTEKSQQTHTTTIRPKRSLEKAEHPDGKPERPELHYGDLTFEHLCGLITATFPPELQKFNLDRLLRDAILKLKAEKNLGFPELFAFLFDPFCEEHLNSLTKTFKKSGDS